MPRPEAPSADTVARSAEIPWVPQGRWHYLEHAQSRLRRYLEHCESEGLTPHDVAY